MSKTLYITPFSELTIYYIFYILKSIYIYINTFDYILTTLNIYILDIETV